MKTYIFKVKLKHDKRVWRKIEVLGNQALDDLHMAIQKAFDFDADHLYSFFMSGKAWDDSDFEYYHPDASREKDGNNLFPDPRLPPRTKGSSNQNENRIAQPQTETEIPLPV